MCLGAPQSKSVSSTDSQPTEERQGPSGGYATQGGVDAKRRRCEEKDPSHYVRFLHQKAHGKIRANHIRGY